MTRTTIEPFASVRLPDRSTERFRAEIENTNAWGYWYESIGETSAEIRHGWQQFLSSDHMGYRGSTLRSDEHGLITVGNDGQPIGYPWYDDKTNKWRDGWVRYSEIPPMGTYLNEVWPKEQLLKVTTNRSKLDIEAFGSPSRCILIEGDGNDIDVEAIQGEQSNLIQDLACVCAWGNGNTVRGWIDGQICGVFFNGQDNRILDASVQVRGIGADRGAVYWKKGSHGFKAVNTICHMGPREFPCIHGDQAFYADDNSSEGILYNCESYGGFTRGFFSHGGSNTTVSRSFKRGQEVVFAPHFTTPEILPTGNVVKA